MGARNALLQVLFWVFIFCYQSNALAIGQQPLSQNSTDLTSSFKVKISGLVLNRYTNTYDSTVTIVNVTNQQISLPVALVVSVQTSGVSVYAPSGVTSDSRAYQLIGSVGQKLDSGKSSIVVIKYKNSNNVKISSTLRILEFPTDNTQVVGGADNNNNGVRDNIESAVSERYRDSERKRTAAFQVLSGYRSALLAQSTVQEAFDSVSKFLTADACMKKIWGAFEGNYGTYEQESRYLESIQLDTLERVRAWLQLGDKVAGQVFIDPEGEPCNFDPNALPN